MGQAGGSSREASSKTTQVTTINDAFRTGSLLIDSHALMGCSEMMPEIGYVSSTAGDWCGGILFSLDRGSTLEWTFPAQRMISIPWNAPNTVSHAANLLLAFLYVPAQI